MIELSEKSYKTRWLFYICLVALCLCSVSIIFWQLGSHPQGLYADESLVGANAASISRNLTDANGNYLPIFFEAFGEYKSPLYIYAAASLFQIFGISEYVLRLTSTVFFLIMAVGSLLLVRKVFPKHPITLLYTLLALTTLPWLFTFSRISFDTIAQPAIFAWALYFIYSAYTQATNRSSLYLAILAGLTTGLAFYSSSTGRFACFVFIATLLLVYRHRDYWKKHIYFLASFIVSLIPYIYFANTSTHHSNKLNFLSYFYNNQLSLSDKLQTLAINYFSYFDPNFLLLHGDSNLRHHSGGLSGQLFIAVAILAILGLSFIVILRNSRHKYFGALLVISALFSPLAAAITDKSHAQFSIMFGFLILLLSVYGIAALEFLPRAKLRRAAISTLSAIMIIQSSLYIYHYFSTYHQQSIQAFESYGLPQSLSTAIAHQPSQIIISDQLNGAQAHKDFYSYIVNNQANIPIDVQVPLANPDTCIITFDSNPDIDNPDNLTPTLVSAHTLVASKSFTNLTCY